MTRNAATLIRTLVFGVVLTLVSATTGSAQDVARIDQVVSSYASAGRFMGAVLVARGDEVLFSRGYGSANLEWSVPNAPSTRFRIASLTKQFTAAAILLLEEHGKIRLDDPVKVYVPDAPATWDDVTIFRLLTHTSGIPDYTRFSNFRSLQRSPATAEQIMSWFRDKPLEFRPGERFAYSNSGYILLGYLIEKLSGRSYAQFVTENILAPLGMNDSGYDAAAVVIPNRASGYVPGPHGPMNAGFVDMSVPYAAGALYSTTGDLSRWEQALFGGKLLSAQSVSRMTTPFKSNYAFGLMVDTTRVGRVIYHNGGIDGFNAYLAYYPDDKVTIVVLANVSGRSPDEIGSILGRLAHGETVLLTSERREISVSRDILAAYVGRYELQPGFDLMIALDGDHLTVNATGQSVAVPLFAESDTLFFQTTVDAQVEFARDPKGLVTHLVLHQNGRDTKAMRK